METHMTQNSESQHDGFKPVTVDQRALIDKMLARYSGEFTVFRELLQNSDDAKSTAVEICFESAPSLTSPDLDSTHVTRWTIRNNGRPFTDEDWKRLTQIAAGNPDTRSIGAFGVGFYSVYSVTDNPAISSQGCTMNFVWQEKQLTFRKTALAKDRDWNTVIELPVQKSGPMPPLPNLMRFLASSIVFMTHLTRVQVLFNNHCIGKVEKTLEKPQAVSLPKGVERSSAEKITMNMEEIQHRRIGIRAEISIGRSKNTEKVDLSMFTAQVKVGVDKDSKDELVRCMKKEPPSSLDYSLIYTGKDEHDRGRSQGSSSHQGTSIFQGLRADLDGARHARIFIGHGTTQTTGIAGHMASRFIPTVERELIDFSDTNKAIQLWNVELLHIGGALCRAVYEWELSNIQQAWEKGTAAVVDSRLSSQLGQQFRHALRFFTFHHSTPSPKVAELLEKSFYGCSSLPLRLLSSVGVRVATDIRAFDPTFGFLKALPMLPSYVIQEPIVTSLPDGHKIRPADASDVQRSLAELALNEEELVQCLRWWIPIWRQKHRGWTERNLLHGATLRSADGKALQLSSVELFIDWRALGSHIPREGPLPDLLLPLNISRSFSREDLASMEWKEFTVLCWLKHLLQPHILSAQPHYDMTLSADWAAQVLGALSSLWASISGEVRRESKEILRNRTCVPTIRGLCRPEESYLPVEYENPFDTRDLAIVEFKSGSGINRAMRTLLSGLGVRGCVPPEVIISRVGEDWEGSISDLIRYLVQANVSSDDVARLKSTRIFATKFPTKGASEKSRHRADELYPPELIFIDLRLPVIVWDAPWSNESEEAKLLYDLGLHRFPSLEKIIELCSLEDTAIQSKAFRYFCDHLESQYSAYDSQKFQHTKFIPAESDGKEATTLKTLEEVCWDSQWKPLGFPIAVVPVADPGSLYVRLGIQQHPLPTKLLDRLRTTTKQEKTASHWLKCLADCTSSFTADQLKEISGMQLIPINSQRTGCLEWVSPAKCYLGQPRDEFTKKLFIFVNFDQKANGFLKACDAKDVPSVKDVAESLINDPDWFYKAAEGPKKFMDKLRELSSEAKRTTDLNSTLEKMVSNHTLLGTQLKKSGDDAQDYKLRRPEEIVIIDDAKDAELFSKHIWTVPQEDLELFYATIGCRKLSKVIQAQLNEPQDLSDGESSQEVKDLVLERLTIFLERNPDLSLKIPFKSFKEKLKVKYCKALRITKTFSIGERKTEVQQVWAATRDGANGEVELWISRDMLRDTYDLAISLCRRLFVTVRSQDTLVLAAMFSGKELLNRAGFNVKHDFKEHLPRTGNYRAGANGNGSKGRCPVACGGVGGSGRTTVGRTHKCEMCDSDGADSEGPRSDKAMSQQSIRDGVELAIERSKPGSGRPKNSIQSPNAQSCHPVHNLECRGNIDGIDIHTAEEFKMIVKDGREYLERFVCIIKPLAKAFKLREKSLHIFYERSGGPIAFNKANKIYLNLRYFKEWHNEDVKIGKLDQALTSWFFTLAHEIAHNLVHDHNSEHEFWFAAICAEHAAGLLKLRQSRTVTTFTFSSWSTFLSNRTAGG